MISKFSNPAINTFDPSCFQMQLMLIHAWNDNQLSIVCWICNPHQSGLRWHRRCHRGGGGIWYNLNNRLTGHSETTSGFSASFFLHTVNNVAVAAVPSEESEELMQGGASQHELPHPHSSLKLQAVHMRFQWPLVGSRGGGQHLEMSGGLENSGEQLLGMQIWAP